MRENTKLETLEHEQMMREEMEEKPGVEEIVDASAVGGVLVLRAGFRYCL